MRAVALHVLTFLHTLATSRSALLAPVHAPMRAPHPPVRAPAARMGGKKKKNSFEEYTINTPNEYLSPIFPLPAQRASIRLHKKHAGKGVAVSKAPADALPPNLCTGYPGLKLLHLDPLVLSVDNFFTADECDAYLALREHECSHKLEQSATFSAATNSARTSTTWFVRYQEATALLARARSLLGVDASHFEEPQLVHYAAGQKFSWHYDAVPPTLLHNGGQRLATLLVYLNDVADGGQTAFRDLQVGGTDSFGLPLRLGVQPKRGRALLFFPSDVDGTPDERTLHAGEPTDHEKWVAQLWLHERPYTPNVPEGSCHDEAAKAIDEYAAAHLAHLQ